MVFAIRGLAIAALAVVSATSALAQSDAIGGAQINDGVFPRGFNCQSLAAAKTRLECQTNQQNLQRSESNDPGTPAIQMPGSPNVIGAGPSESDSPSNPIPEIHLGRGTGSNK
jgi:hypothetical protein